MKQIFGSIRPSSFQPLFGGIGFGSLLYDLAQAKPSLDLRFADNKSLVDATTGQNLVTFTRASSGTFVGSDGVLQSAVTNLLLRSEELGTAWVRFGTTTLTENTSVAPNGTTTGDNIVFTSASSGIYQSNPGSASTTYVFSIYIKSSTSTQVKVVINTNLSDPVIQTVTVTSEWQRFSVTKTTSVGTTSVAVQIQDNGSGSTQFDLWGAQLEQAATAGEYIPTTSTINSAPRFDHNPTTGESLGLLVEEQRTNLLTYSDDFGNVAWTSVAATLSSNAATAPDGTLTADSYTATAVSGEHRIFRVLQATVTASSTITFSVFVKASGVTRLRLNVYDSPSRIKEIVANVNLSTGTINTPTAQGGYTAVASSIQVYSNSFYRISITGTVDAATTLVLCDLGLQNSAGNGSWTPTGTEALIVWGAQLEAGAFPTSYIPTTTAAATRSVDVCSITGSAFTGFYRQDEGSFFCSTFAPKGNVVYGTGDTFDNTQYISAGSSNNVFIRSGGALSAFLTAPISTTTVTNIAHGYATDNFAAVSNGGVISTDTGGAVPLAQVRLKLGSSAWDSDGSNNINGTIRRLCYWPTRLGNQVLQSITQ